jgi:hypothetical protein
MKKIGMVMIALLVCGLTAFGAMDDKDFSSTVVGAGTGTVSYVLRGELAGIYVDVETASTTTQTVTLASSQQTLFTKDMSADGWYPLQYAQYGSTGSALTFDSTTGTNAWYNNAPMAGLITLTVTGKNAASSTNTTTVTVIYDK